MAATTGERKRAEVGTEIEESRFAASPGWELYTRVDPFGQIAATNFKKNMSLPLLPFAVTSTLDNVLPLATPALALRELGSALAPCTAGRTLMRKISKRRSTAGNCLVKLPKCSGRGHYEASKGAGTSTTRSLPLRGGRDEDEEEEMKGVARGRQEEWQASGRICESSPSVLTRVHRPSRACFNPETPRG